jgi:hypothetical protein
LALLRAATVRALTARVRIVKVLMLMRFSSVG